MILVTGAAGMSGAMIVREFSRQGIRVKALVRDIGKAPEFDPTFVEVVQGDMARPETLAGALDGVEKAVMISSAGKEMVATQCAFVDACVTAGVGHVIKFSGAELGFRRSAFRFTEMHAQAEEYLEQSGLEWTHLRPGGFMQVYLRELPNITKRGELRLAFGEISLAPVDANDVARITTKITLSPDQGGRTYVITGPEALTMSDVAERFGHALGRPVRYVPIDVEERRRDLLAAGAPPYFVDGLIEQVIERLRNPVAKVRLDAHERFGVTPTMFAAFLEGQMSGLVEKAA